MTITKSKRHRYNKTVKRKIKGGDINKSYIFKYIKSIGFEIETTDLIKFTVENFENSKILVNSALTNIDLEYGYFDENEYTDIIDTPELKFKITNDSAEDSEFNEDMLNIFNTHKNDDDDDCEEVIFQLEIPKNNYLNKTLDDNQTRYDIKIREADSELHNCSSFTDVEWILTYYKPIVSQNIILNTFYNSMNLLKQHLNNLKTIEGTKLYYLNDDNEYVQYENSKINQVYVLPGTSLVYFNNSVYDIDNYDINKNLKIVVQMTFSCDIQYVYRVMKKLLSMEYTTEQLTFAKKFIDKSNKNMIEINQMIEQYIKNESFDLDAINNALVIVKNLFYSYNNDTNNSEYLFVTDNSDINKLKMYFFLIMYKLYIYLNSYIQNKEENEESLFKKNLSFAVRHNNYSLYLEIKKYIKIIFTSKFYGKDDKFINNKIIEIIRNIIGPINKEKKIYQLIYRFNYTRERKKELHLKAKEYPDKYFGDPLYSILSYFEHFEKRKDDKKDWLVLKDIDEKSTKFDLNDDTIIVEFRDFPSYCYLNLLMNSNNDIREEILQNNIGTLNMKIVNDFMNLHNLS